MKRYINCFCFIIALVFFIHSELSAKVRILTFHCNKPDFIEMQYKTLKKFLLEDFELIVFNDARLTKDEEEIQEMCDKYGIKCVRFEPKWHRTNPLNDYLIKLLKDPAIYSHINFLGSPSNEVFADQGSVRHCHVIQYALDNYGYNHGDAFLIRPLSLRQMLAPYDIIGIQRYFAEESIDYLWVVFIAFNPQKLPDHHDLKFHLDAINGKLHDSGAHSYHYLKNHPSVKERKYIGVASSGMHYLDYSNLQWRGYNENEIWLIKNLPYSSNVEFQMDKHILHSGASSLAMEDSQIKEDCVREFIKLRLNDRLNKTVFANFALKQKYQLACSTPSDIYQHVSTLRSLAMECSSVVEIGLRSMVSTWGILLGLSESPFTSHCYYGIDIQCPLNDTLNYARKLAEESGILFNFWQANDMHIDIEPTDMLMIDSLHTYCHLTYELEKFSPKVNKYIVMHDTSAPWGDNEDSEYHGDYSEYPPEYDRSKKGLWPAVEDFLKRHPEWALYDRYFNCHGLTILKRTTAVKN
jgi:hypothetical protein